MPKYIYKHPDGKGLGEHHAGDLSGRPSIPIGAPPGWAEGLKDQLGFLGLTPEQEAELDKHAGRTMADLDLHDGTGVELLEDDASGLKRVAWTDQHGDARITSVEPGLFAEFFTAALEG